MAHAQVSVEPYGGTEKEDFSEFEQLFQGYIGVAAIPNAQQANFLQLHLRDNALRFYQTLGPATRANVPASLIALRDHFCNPQLQEIHVLNLEQLRFNPKTDTPENFLVNLTKKAQRAYPTPDLPAVAPIDPAIIGAPAAAEAARFHRETAQRQERIDAVHDNRNEQIKRLFIKGMPGWLRSKLMEQPPATTVQELCNLTKKQITIREICRKDDYPEDGFNEINDKVSEKLISAITKMSTNQEKMEKQLNEMRSQITEQSNKQSNPLPEQNRNNNSQSDQYSGYQPNQNTWYGQQRGNRGGRRRNNWQNKFDFNNTQPNFHHMPPVAQQPYSQLYPQNQQYPNMYQNQQPMVQMHPSAQFQQSQNYPTQHFVANQMPQAETQNPNGPFGPMVRSSAKFCDVCGKFNHTASQCWWRQKPQGRGQNFPFPNEPKN